MAIRIQTKLNRPELQRFLNAIDEKTLRKVVSRSLNRTGVTVRKEAAQRIQKKSSCPPRISKTLCLSGTNPRPVNLLIRRSSRSPPALEVFL